MLKIWGRELKTYICHQLQTPLGLFHSGMRLQIGVDSIIGANTHTPVHSCFTRQSYKAAMYSRLCPPIQTRLGYNLIATVVPAIRTTTSCG